MTQNASDTQESSILSDVPPEAEENLQTNGHGIEDAVKVEDGGEERPNKRQRVGETTPKSKPRAKKESPPWKLGEVERASVVSKDGIRRASRHLPKHKEEAVEPAQPQRSAAKRLSRRLTSALEQNATSGATNPLQARDISSTPVNRSRRAAATDSKSSPQPPKSLPPPKRSHHKKTAPAEPSATPKRSHKKKVPTTAPQSDPAPSRLSKSRREEISIGNHGEVASVGRSHPLQNSESVSQSTKARISRIKFRVKPPELPLIHPGLVIQRPKRYETFGEFLEKEAGVPVEKGGLYTAEDANDHSDEMVVRDAQILLRLEDAAEPGGILAPDVCSVYQPEEQEQPPPQYSHLDHLNRAAIEFRRLLVMEERKHKQAAKRLADACREEWYRRQPKSSDQLEADKMKAALGYYKHLVKILQGTWDNVRAEVNRQRLLEWEAQEKERVRKALNEAVDISTQKLEARRGPRDSELLSDEDGDIEEDGSDQSEDNGSNSENETQDDSDEDQADDGESNMSESESEGDDDETVRPEVAEDEHLSVEQLRVKYASLPSVPITQDDEDMPDADEYDTPNIENTKVLDDDDSDESVDMDDDMGSSDEDRNSDDSEEDGDDEESEEQGESTLLGFLAPAELESIQVPPENPVPAEAIVPDFEENNAEIDMEGKEVIPSESEQEDSVQKPIIEVVESTTFDLEDSKSILDKNDTDMEESAFIPVVDTGKLKTADSNINKTTSGAILASPDRSSPTPRTTSSRPSEVDSASSVDHQSRHVTESATPQPSNGIKTPVPFLLRGTLREYQHYGLDWLAGLYANNTNGILADEMGLGKTIQTIALLAHLACVHEVWGPHLVIVPTSVMLNWEMEFKKFLPGFKVLTYYGNQDERKKKRQGWKNDDSWNVIITSYQLVLQDRQVFKHRRWHYMILDEAHNIKNFQSQRWQAMLTFNTRARLLLTGTPLQNNLTELWSLLYFLMPSDGSGSGGVSGFTDLKEFKNFFDNPEKKILEHGRDQLDEESMAIIGKLHKVLRPYLLRRLKADVEKQMPGKYEHVEWCRLSKRQRELYDGFLSRDDTRGTLASGNYLSIINCLMQLRKVCNHPDLFIERAIMTSFPMEKSAVSNFEIKDLLVRRRLLREDPMSKVSLEFLNLVPAKHETFSKAMTIRVHFLSAQKALMDARESQRTRAQNAFTTLDPSTTKSNLVYLESASRWGRFEELQHCVYLNALRRQQNPIYGTRLVELLTIGADERPFKPRPKRRADLLPWLFESSSVLTEMVPTLAARSQALNTTIQKFACVTPAVVARDMTTQAISQRGVEVLQSSVTASEMDPFHEARMRLSIQFPDKRLLQYDCGKLQALAKLLRKLQAQGSRALIFTQMTKVLDILEQFLNIHGHKYLRLDGSTKIEQRQALTDRFNNDNRILAFILSSRSGGLGINLTGADTVIFYDLDWNPAMDKQCQDRAHRIGQTRDVHIYRLVSEHTIEANILRKANQKRMLDDVVIQEGDFTTDHFNKASAPEIVLGEEADVLEGDDGAAAANAAMDRVLGGPDNSKNISRVLAHAEDKEDVVAASIAEREVVQTDAADFDEMALTATGTTTGVGTPQEVLAEEPIALDDVMDIVDDDDLNAWGARIKSTDEYMLKFMTEQLKDTPVELPRDKNRSKRGKDRRRSHRAR